MSSERGLRVASSDFETTSRNLKIRDTPKLRLAMVGYGPRYVLGFSGLINPSSQEATTNTYSPSEWNPTFSLAPS